MSSNYIKFIRKFSLPIVARMYFPLLAGYLAGCMFGAHKFKIFDLTFLILIFTVIYVATATIFYFLRVQKRATGAKKRVV